MRYFTDLIADINLQIELYRATKEVLIYTEGYKYNTDLYKLIEAVDHIVKRLPELENLAIEPEFKVRVFSKPTNHPIWDQYKYFATYDQAREYSSRLEKAGRQCIIERIIKS